MAGVDWNKNMHWEPYIKMTDTRKELINRCLDMLYKYKGWEGENKPPKPIDKSFRDNLSRWSSVDIIAEHNDLVARIKKRRKNV